MPSRTLSPADVLALRKLPSRARVRGVRASVSLGPNNPSLKALRECAQWLSFCLSVGWRRDQLDALEGLWWEYHDAKGKVIV